MYAYKEQHVDTRTLLVTQKLSQVHKTLSRVESK